MDDRARMALLLRRACFGGRHDELDAAVAAGWQVTVDALLSGSALPGTAPVLGAKAVDPGVAATPAPVLSPATAFTGPARKDPAVRRRLAAERQALELWWLDRMTAVANPWPEKRTWFWHGHFATAISKVRAPAWMLAQQDALRSNGNGPFSTLLRSMVSDPAMLVWLDGRTNVRAHPNENFARESMELFALGHGNYTEDDVRELARAFTGWRIDPTTGQARFVPARHDPGPVTVLGHTGSLDTDQAVALLTASSPCPAFIAARAWSRFIAPALPGDPATQPLVDALGPDRHLARMWRTLLESPELATGAADGALVKQPVEWVVGVLRALRLRARDVPAVLATLTGLGQTPFDPPNVGGWPQNHAWLTTSAVLVRSRFALEVATRADLSLVADQPVRSRVDAAAALFSVARWSGPSRQALSGVATDPHRLVALAAISPENLVA